MLSKIVLFLGLCTLIGTGQPKGASYSKEYDNNGKLIAEGWLNMEQKKVNYWTFYHPNGKKSEQGHYKNGKREKYWHFYQTTGKKAKEGHYDKGKMVKWWLFYDHQGRVNHKCQLSGGIKNGYCLKYNNEKLIAAQKYTNGKKIKEWYSLRSFKRENNLSDLR